MFSTPIRSCLCVYSLMPFRIYAQGFSYIRSGLLVYTLRASRIYAQLVANRRVGSGLGEALKAGVFLQVGFSACEAVFFEVKMYFSTLADIPKIYISLIDMALTCFWVVEIFHTFLLVRWQKCPIFAPSEGYKSAFDR